MTDYSLSKCDCVDKERTETGLACVHDAFVAEWMNDADIVIQCEQEKVQSSCN